MRFSHSKLSLALSDPMSYFLRYKVGIYPAQTKAAFGLGSAVHWGLEHWTDNLDEYYNTQQFSNEQCLAEAMVHGFLAIKDKVFEQILTDKFTGEKATILDGGEKHELHLYAPIKSKNHDEPNEFEGIIDLLLLTDKGFIIIDWKTSSFEPDWNGYLEQIYRYVFICQALWQQIPVYKVGIVNLRKTRCSQGAKESVIAFRERMKKTFLDSPDNFYYVHTWEPEELNQELFNDYTENLAKQIDLAEMIDLNNMFYINYGGQVSKYGKSDYYNIFYRMPDAFAAYNISDTVLDDKGQLTKGTRPCVPIDMECFEKQNVLNKYEQFKNAFYAYYSVAQDIDKFAFFASLQKIYVVDIELLERYWSYLCTEIEKSKS